MALIDLNGKTFGRLQVVGRLESSVKSTRWLCLCECGKETSPTSFNLRSGITKSCGCLANERTGKRLKKHGFCSNPLYRTWHGMHGRCKNPKDRSYRLYGGRGIKVCRRWQSVENFIKDMGEKPSMDHSLDRIDPNGDYSPENCRWSTYADQQSNKRCSRFIEWNGKSMTCAQWATIVGIRSETIYERIHRQKWTPERALTTKPIEKHRSSSIQHPRQEGGV